MNDLDGRLGTNFTLAHIYRKDGKYEKALYHADIAWQIVSRVRGESKLQSLNHKFAERIYDFSAFTLDLLLELAQRFPQDGYGAKAFYVYEQGRARSLREHLLTGMGFDTIRSQDHQKLDALERERASLDERQPERVDYLENEIRHLLIALDKTRPLQESHQDTPTPNMIENLHRSLDPQTALLVYFIGDRRSCLWEIDSRGWKLHLLPARTILEADMVPYLRLLGSPAASGSRRRRVLGRRVYEKLLGPLSSISEKKRLVIVPDGILNTLPFAALPDPRQEGVPLVNNHEIIYLPSLTIGKNVAATEWEYIRHRFRHCPG